MALFHILSRADWARALRAGVHAPPSLEAEGFVHLSTEHQVVATAQRFFAERTDLVALRLREDRLDARIRYEAAEGDVFPHLYGSLPVGAVEAVLPLVPGARTPWEPAGFILASRGDTLARSLAAAYGALADVEAVALGGSRTGPAGPDASSDVDVYVYSAQAVPLDTRRSIAEAHGECGTLELGNSFWEDNDEWVSHGASEGDVEVDVMFRMTEWIEGELARVLDRHEARLGYTTCFVHNVRSSTVLFDRTGRFASWQTRASTAYPDALRDAIVAKNHPVLRDRRSSYIRQLRRAEARGDQVATQHRTAAFLASVFDIVFAVNRVMHPGEKRLLETVPLVCPSRPAGFEDAVRALLAAPSHGHGGISSHAEGLVDAIDAWLAAEGVMMHEESRRP
jgi:uncharacterized protein (DUF952 family)